MINDLTKDVQKAVKEYIDNVDERKISDRTLDKLEKLYKGFTENIYIQVKPILKENREIQNEVQKIKKIKLPKGSTKFERINLNKKNISDLFILFKYHGVLEELIESYKYFVLNIKSIKNWNKYEQWIGWALDFGEDSYLATHIGKLTHSSSKGASIDVRHYDSCNKYNTNYVCTSDQPELDTAYPDNKYSSISQLYNIKVAGFFIGDLLREGGQEYLKVFTKNEELLKYWVGSFTRYIKNEEKKSYFLSKQVYFPIANKQYHLLLPLTSSSLVHELHLEQKKYFEEDQTLARKQKSDKKYSLVETCTYPNKAYLHVTGSNHSNASSLNGKRGGRIALLPTMPPQWKSRLPSYVNKHNIFDKTLAFELRAEINELRDYLLLIKNKSLSISEPKRNATVINKLQAISNQLFNYLEKINDNESQDGWTIGSKLPDEQQLMFEPCREDVAIKILKTNYQWQKKLSKTYGRWLNKQLTQKDKLNLTLIQESLWANVFLIELREYIATQEVIL